MSESSYSEQDQPDHESSDSQMNLDDEMKLVKSPAQSPPLVTPAASVSPATKVKGAGKNPFLLAPLQGDQMVKIKYQTCDKKGLHQGECLNLVCLEKGCLESCSICAVCFEQEHKTHHVLPLKLVAEHARRMQGRQEKSKELLKELQTHIPNLLNKQLQKHEELQKSITPIFEVTKEQLTHQNVKIQQQLTTRVEQQSIFNRIESLQHQDMESNQFTKLISQLQDGVPSDADNDSTGTPITENDHIKYIENVNKSVEAQVQLTSTAVLGELKKHETFLKKMIESDALLTGKNPNYEFDPEMKHSSIQLITPNSAKSTVGGDYNFALLGPALDPTSFYTNFAFKVVKCTSNWVAVGICHQKTAENNEYKFSYSTTDHGGYLISTNGGSWSALSVDKNNTVKAFKFKTGDIIYVLVDFSKKTVTFQKKSKKKSPTNTYMIEFTEKENDPLHLCALFFYKNDEIEYLGRAEDNGLGDEQPLGEGDDVIQDPVDPGYYSYDDEWS